jgi:hypothetical protein
LLEPVIDFRTLKKGVDSVEQHLRDVLADDETPPYLGLVDLDDSQRSVVHSYLLQQHDRAYGLVRLAARAPACAVYVLARLATEKLGAESGVDFYPHVERYLEVPKLSNSQRREIYQAFLDARHLLGLDPLTGGAAPEISDTTETSDRHRWVTSYAMQGGITHRMAQPFALAVNRTARFLGPPRNVDDTVELAQWMSNAIRRLPQGEIRLRRILELDIGAHYLRRYVALWTGDTARNDFERQLSALLANRGRLDEPPEPPQLWLRGDTLALRFDQPPKGAYWEINTGRGYETVSPDQEFREIDTHIGSIEYRLLGADQIESGAVDGLDPGRDEPRPMVFSATGGACHGQIAPSSPLTLAPGDYRLLARDDMTLDDCESYSLQPGVQCLEIAVEHRSLEIHSVGRRLRIEPVLQPRITFLGDSMPDRQGHRLYAGQALSIRVDMPASIDTTNRNFEILLRPLNIRLPLEIGERSTPVPLGGAWPDSPYIVSLKALVVEQGQSRRLASSMAYVVIGCERISDGFFHGRRPRKSISKRADISAY